MTTPAPAAASDLIRRHAPEWRAATCHSFLHSVREGRLTLGAFIAWLQQDYLLVNDLLVF
jgi:thiaminase